jgi:hypothetical protein
MLRFYDCAEVRLCVERELQRQVAVGISDATGPVGDSVPTANVKENKDAPQLISDDVVVTEVRARSIVWQHQRVGHMGDRHSSQL